MQPDWKTLGPEGLTFFGRMCASVSHELKNSLAMINENAGLINDLIMMAERGKPMDTALLAKAAKRIDANVGKADAIIGNLNRFAHLADHPVSSIDLRENVALAVQLHQRLASQRQVALTMDTDGEAVEVRTRPFLLANAVHDCLSLVIDAAREGSVHVAVAPVPDGAAIHFKGSGAPIAVPEGMASELFSALEARIECASGELVLTISDLTTVNDDK